MPANSRWDLIRALKGYNVSSLTITYKPHYYPHIIPGLSTSGFSAHEAAKAWRKC